MNVMDSAPAKSSLMSPESDIQRTQYPYVTGTSVVGIKYKDGILLAADMGGSYGSTIRYKSVERLKPVGKHSLLGASGEISDFQEIMKYLDELILYDNMWDDGNSLGPKEVHNYLTRVMYNRRNKFNPLWNSLVLGGVKNGQKYLGTVSMIGVHYEDNHVATGFGNHLARPILRDEWHENLSYEEGVKLLEKCMRVLLYRDRSAVNKLQIAKITEEGVTISQPYSLKTFWNFSAFQNPTVGAEGSWRRFQWPEPYLLGFFCLEKRSQSCFFYSSKESPLVIGSSLDESVNFIGEKVYIVASSNGFLLCNKLRSRQRVYYVYNPATRQRLDVPKTPISMDDPYIGFTCKVDEDHGIVSFTIVRYVISEHYQSSITIESFSSEINVWTDYKLIVDVPHALYPSLDGTSLSSAGVVDGIFFWLNYTLITIYDSVNKCFWALELPENLFFYYPRSCCLGLSGGELCFASNRWTTTITCWRLNNFPSRDNAKWVIKYVINVATLIKKYPKYFGVGDGIAKVQNMVFHPALPHILYLQIKGKKLGGRQNATNCFPMSGLNGRVFCSQMDNLRLLANEYLRCYVAEVPSVLSKAKSAKKL
ncbi:hypothetical protein KY285_009230 [Solanum tuberosum]|nr:hypothetical protein KY285_009230 [Solanum tuberosum]